MPLNGIGYRRLYSCTVLIYSSTDFVSSSVHLIEKTNTSTFNKKRGILEY